jgi:hypothetical protein
MAVSIVADVRRKIEETKKKPEEETNMSLQ